MAFHDARLDTTIENGAVGGPRFKTTVLSSDSGFEQRNIDWTAARAEFDVSHAIKDRTTYHSLLDFFYARQGRAHSFRFKDWTDYEMGNPNIPTSGTALQFGLGDGTTTIFQVYKPYTDASITYNRKLTKIVAATYTVYDETSLLTEGGGSDYTIDITTGLITFNSAPLGTGGTGPGGAHILAANLEFDVHVRFDVDNLQANMDFYNHVSWDSILLVEIKE